MSDLIYRRTLITVLFGLGFSLALKSNKKITNTLY
jgi:hypothetical protein